MPQCFIGLGSNQADPAQQLRRACVAIAALADTHVLQCSPFYRSVPLGPADQPDYVNAVIAVDTDLPALTLLDGLQEIERSQGRIRNGERWGPRTLDLDILLYGTQQLDLPRLKVPHYHMHARPFVLYPLADIAPTLRLPDGTELAELLSKCPAEGLERLPGQPADALKT